MSTVIHLCLFQSPQFMSVECNFCTFCPIPILIFLQNFLINTLLKNVSKCISERNFINSKTEAKSLVFNRSWNLLHVNKNIESLPTAFCHQQLTYQALRNMSLTCWSLQLVGFVYTACIPAVDRVCLHSMHPCSG